MRLLPTLALIVGLTLAAPPLLAQPAPAAASAEAPELTNWSHEALGFSMSYPASMTLITDPAILAQIMQQAATIADTRETGQAPIGPVFTMLRFPPGQVPNPALNLSTIEIPKEAKKMKPDEFASEVMAGVSGTIPASRQVEPVSKVTIADRDFYSSSWEFVVEGTLVKLRAFFSHDRKRNRGYLITFADDAMAFADRTAPFEDVIRSMRIQ